MAGFCFFTILANISKLETTPFFIWGMYSEKEPDAKNYTVYEIVVNDSCCLDYSAGFTDNHRFYLSLPLDHYYTQVLNGGEDPLKKIIQKKFKNYFYLLDYPFIFQDTLNANFVEWYMAYLKETLHQEINHLKVDVVFIQYNSDNQMAVLETKPFIEWRKK